MAHCPNCGQTFIEAADGHWSDGELAAMDAMLSIDFPTAAIASLLGRSHRATRNQAYRRGHLNPGRRPYPNQFKQHLNDEVFTALRDRAAELKMSPSELCRVLLTAIHRDNLWASVLDLPGASPIPAV